MERRFGMMATIALTFVMVMVGYCLAGPVPDTGQTKCYNDAGNEITCPQPGEAFYGQDGSYTINPPSYTKLDATGNALPDSAASWVTVRDNVTGLIWEVKANMDGIKDDTNPSDADNTYTWYDPNPATNGGDAGTPGDGTDTLDFITALNTANFSGYSDWRLPTIKELHSIVAYDRYQPSIDTAYFPNTPGASPDYYSATTYTYIPGGRVARVFDFFHGRGTAYYKSEGHYVRAVRGGASQNNFSDNGDGTVTDASTGLMWQQANTSYGYTWAEALDYCEGLELAGYTDWRLPTIKELFSIADLSSDNLNIDTTLFPNTQGRGQWSSTTDVTLTGYDPDYALEINFFGANFTSGQKSGSSSVRAVRGVQSGALAERIMPQAVYRFEQGDRPSGSVDLGDGVTVTFTGDIEVAIVDNHLGFYLGQRPVQSLMASAAEQATAGSLSFTLEEPIKSFTVQAADFEGNTTISAYDSANQLVETIQVKGSTSETYELAGEQSIAKVVISSSSGWVGTTEELSVIIGKIVSQLDGTAVQGVTVTISPSNRQGVSDAIGNYTVTGIKPGTYTLTGTGNKVATIRLTGLNISSGSTLIQDLAVLIPVDGGYSVTADLWAKAVLELSGSPVALVWQPVGADLTPSGDQVISGYFYADPDDFAYGSQYNPEVFVKIYIAASGWCNIAFNHVTVDPVTVSSAYQYANTADQSSSATLDSRLVQHEYSGVAIDTSKQSTGGASGTSGATGCDLGASLWSKAVLQVPGNPVTLVWKEVGTDNTPSGAKVVSGYFYADPNDFAYGSLYNPEVFVKVYIDPSGWCNMAFNHVTVDPVAIDSATGMPARPTRAAR